MHIPNTEEAFLPNIDIRESCPSTPTARSFAEWDSLAGHPPRTDEVLDQSFRYATGLGAGLLIQLKWKEKNHE
jgi:hypothetical protein